MSSLPKVRRVALVLGGSLLLLATAPWAFAQAKAQTKAKASPPPKATAPATGPPLAQRASGRATSTA